MGRRGAARLGAGLVVGFLIAGAPPVRADIAVERDFPRRGETVTLTVTDAAGEPSPGAVIAVVYRPQTSVPRETALPPTGPDGSVAWTPEEAGLAGLTATLADSTTQTRNLSVAFPGVPLPGLLVLVAAGIILYGGVVNGFRRLGDEPPALPPDT